MSQGEEPPEPTPSLKSLAVACIVLARYLHARDPGLATYLKASLRHAEESGLDPSDLHLLRLLIGAVGPPGAR